MKKMLSLSLVSLFVALCLPLVFLRAPAQTGGIGSSPAPTVSASPEPTVELPAPATGETDSQTYFNVLTGDGIARLSMAEYLPGVLAGEMPASFDTEALKAQAVAGRTYILYHMAHPSENHPVADVCSQAGCCKAWLDDEALREKWGNDYEKNLARIARAVEETDGEYITWEGQAIQAVFHSSSGGKTESSANIWSYAPYLVSVDSPETPDTVPNLITTVTVSAGDFRDAVLSVCPQADFSGEADTWLGASVINSSGRITRWHIAGLDISGKELRTLFSLRSTDFSLEYSDGNFVFTVIGYGHGVGMSQYGANLMAKSGCGYREILSHYYPGTDISS